MHVYTDLLGIDLSILKDDNQSLDKFEKDFPFNTENCCQEKKLPVIYLRQKNFHNLQNSWCFALQVKQITGEDRVRLYYNLVHTRRQIIDSNILKKPQDQGSNFIVSTLRRCEQAP